MRKAPNGRQITKIQHEIFRAMMIIVIVMTVITTMISIYVNLLSEKKSLDNNLRNIAYTISQSELIISEVEADNLSEERSFVYLDSVKSSLSNVDVISIISNEGIRLYHTNRNLVGTEYDGTIPDFSGEGKMYVTSDVGPSGAQRRVYAGIYDESGQYVGFVIVVLLNQNIYKIITNTILIQLIASIIIIAISVVLSNSISRKIKHSLWGYEPDAFSAMYSVRDNILESFEEGIIAIDYDEKILFMNRSARNLMGVPDKYSLNIKDYPMLSRKDLKTVLKSNEHLVGIHCRLPGNKDAIVNYYPVNENGVLIGALCVLVDRTEYTRIAEDLSGVKFLVDSMRANNHDFTNKLHVILGLIQMGATKEATEYISHITTIQREVISYVMNNIEDPSVAALIIGKYSKASELNISFSLEKGSQYRRNDVSINSSDLITIIGNLIENAFEAMNSCPDSELKELSVGIFTRPGAMIIRVDDSGPGIPENIREHLYDSGVTTKGDNHGNGLFLVSQIIKRYNGTIDCETELGEGTSFSVTLLDDGGNANV